MASNDFLVEYSEHVLTLTFNRPDKLNAVTYDMQAEMMAAFERADRDDDVRVVVVTGTGKGFCAGTDLSGGGLARITGEGNAPPPARRIPLVGRAELRVSEIEGSPFTGKHPETTAVFRGVRTTRTESARFFAGTRSAKRRYSASPSPSTWRNRQTPAGR